MSMTLITAWQMAWVGILYCLTVVLLPYIVWRRRLLKMPVVERFLFCFVVGSFWLINATLLLAMVSFANWFTLVLATYGVALAVAYSRNRDRVNEFLLVQARAVKWLFTGELRGVLYFRRALLRGGRRILAALKRLWRWMRPHLPELIVLAVCSLGNLWYFSYQTFNYGGAATADIAVHASWINALHDGTVFYNGVYPYGFHCLMYYLGCVFNIDTFVLLRVFGPIQALGLYTMFYLLARKLCRGVAGPMVAYVVMSFTAAFARMTMMRFQWPLPQENAMLFLYPMLLYVLSYLRARHGELKEKRPRERKRGLRARLAALPPSTQPLLLFTLSLSLTLTIHFYITLIALLVCGAVFVAWLPGILRPKVLGRLLLCGALSAVLGIAPLAVAIAAGTPAEPSLAWAQGVMSKGSGSSKAETEKEPLLTQIDTKLRNDFQYVAKGDWLLVAIFLLALALLAGLAGLAIRRARLYARGWLTIALFSLVMSALYIPGVFGLPKLMSDDRVAVFLMYTLGLLYALPVDMVGALASRGEKSRRAVELCASALCLGAVFVLRFTPVSENVSIAKPLTYFYNLQYGENVTIMYDLINNYPDGSWTLVSTVSETQQVYGHGWHYEISEFLKAQEKWKDSDSLYIPTEYVFLLLEKNALESKQVVNMESGTINTTPVSDALAEEPLKWNRTSAAYYYYDKRPQVMSRLNKWLEAYVRLYPDSCQVYYESENSVCYRLRQNVYFPLNFSIDYGVNEAGGEDK